MYSTIITRLCWRNTRRWIALCSVILIWRRKGLAARKSISFGRWGMDMASGRHYSINNSVVSQKGALG